MSDSTPTLAAETETMREYYAAINRNDVAAAVTGFDPQIEWTEPEGFPGAGTVRGLDAVRAHITKNRGSWVEGSCEPEQFIAAGDKLVVFVSVRARLKDETEWREGRLGEVYTFRNGRVIQGRLFHEVDQALDWVGVADPDAN